MGLAVGVVGHLRAQFPDISSEGILRILHVTSTEFDPSISDAEQVIDIDAAEK